MFAFKALLLALVPFVIASPVALMDSTTTTLPTQNTTSPWVMSDDITGSYLYNGSIYAVVKEAVAKDPYHAAGATCHSKEDHFFHYSDKNAIQNCMTPLLASAPCEPKQWKCFADNFKAMENCYPNKLHWGCQGDGLHKAIVGAKKMAEKKAKSQKKAKSHK